MTRGSLLSVITVDTISDIVLIHNAPLWFKWEHLNKMIFFMAVNSYPMQIERIINPAQFAILFTFLKHFLLSLGEPC